MGLELMEVLIRCEDEFGVQFGNDFAIPRTPLELSQLILKERNSARSYFAARSKTYKEGDVSRRVLEIIAECYQINAAELSESSDLVRLR